MKKGSFHSAGRLDVGMLINRLRVQRFIFLAGGSAFDITDFTWALNIKQNKGSWTNLIALTTNGGGLTFPVYETNILDARFEAAQVNVPTIKEGKAYWELVRTDTNETWISGEIDFQYGLLDSGGLNQEVTVNLTNETITVELSAIVNVSGGSSGGGSDFYRGDFTMTTLYPAAGTGSGTAGAIQAGDQWRLIIAAGEATIGGVQYLDGQLIEAAIDAPGQTTANWIRIIT